MMGSPKLLFVSATAMEVRAFLDTRACRRTEGPGHTLFLSPGNAWACLITGPGGFSTAAGLGACFSRFMPEMVIDVGIAGVFKGSGLSIGDLAVAESDTYVHTGVGDSLPLPFDLIPGEQDSREGVYALDRCAIEACRTAMAGSDPVAPPSGPFLTVSNLADSREKARTLCAGRAYLMESMEGAAAAHVCALYNVPMAEVRAGSNFTGDRDKTRWDIPAACRALDRALTCLKDIFP